MSYSSGFWSNFWNYYFLTVSSKATTRKMLKCGNLKLWPESFFFQCFFLGPWGQDVIFEVAEAKFWILSIFYEFSFKLSLSGFQGYLTSATSATSERAQGIFSKITFSLSVVCSNKKDEVSHGFLVNIFTISLHRGGVIWYPLTPQTDAQTYHVMSFLFYRKYW